MLSLYQQRRVPVLDAVRQVRDGDSIVLPTGVGEPPSLMAALTAERSRFRDVQVVQLLPMRPHAYLTPDSRAQVRHLSMFFSGVTRPGGQAGWIDWVPSNFSEIPALIDRGEVPCDVVFTLASAMDEHGYFSVSLGTDYTMAAIRKARAVVLEVNANVPQAHGECRVHVSQVAALVESDAPILEAPAPKVSEAHAIIGSHVADLINDGATLQIGYGGIPEAVARQLRGKRDLGIHTEMFGDALLSLVECGAVTGSRKNFMPGKIVATFALGTRRLYEFMHRNPMLEMHPVDFTNDPYSAARNDNLVAINATLQVDLLGQCGSESLGFLPYSGTGGQSDFVRAANRSRGGKSIMVLTSTAKQGTVSRIVPTLTPGTHVTTSKNDVNYVVTEFGVAQLRGKSARERARALISIAHPDSRAGLEEAAAKMGVFGI